MSSELRSDLQIVRAIAVLCVLFFHLDIAFFSGGFIGVDVFFVLSGYFIAKTLLSGGEKIGIREILSFYNRRIRRILPLALFVCTIFLVLGPFVLPSIELKELTLQIIASATGWPNMLFVADESYFRDTLFRPMLHFWSLGVEYQYYLVFPFIFLFVQRVRFLGMLLLIGSLFLCATKTEGNQPEAFYWMITRLWEFLLGFYAFRYEGRIKEGRSLVSLAALSAIFCCAVFYDSEMMFPGYIAAVPALAAFFLIMCGLPDSKGILQRPSNILVWLGTISFSIYLWHYPVIWAFKYQPFIYNGLAPSGLSLVLVCLVTLVFSALSYRYIETPCRSKKIISDRSFYMGVAAIYIIILGLSYTYYRAAFELKDYSSAQVMAIKAFEDRLPHRCRASLKKSDQYKSCSLGSEHKKPDRKVLLVGNSHADSLKPVFISEAEGRNINFYLLRKARNPGQEGLTAKEVMEAVKEREITDLVFHGLIKKHHQTYDVMRELIQDAKKSGLRVHIIDQTPMFPGSIPTDIYTGKNEIRLTREDYDASNEAYYDWKGDILKEYPEVRFYAVKDILCPDVCILQKDGVVLYYDSHHLNINGSYLLRPIVRKIYALDKR